MVLAPFVSRRPQPSAPDDKSGFLALRNELDLYLGFLQDAVLSTVTGQGRDGSFIESLIVS